MLFVGRCKQKEKRVQICHVLVLKLMEARKSFMGEEDELLAWSIGEGNQDVSVFVGSVHVAIEPHLGVVERLVVFIEDFEYVSVQGSRVSMKDLHDSCVPLDTNPLDEFELSLMYYSTATLPVSNELQTRNK